MNDDRIIEKIASANRCHDVIAILRDGSVHMISDMHAAGITVRVGMNFEDCREAFDRTPKRRVDRRIAG